MQIKNEIAYQITMKYLKQLLEQKLISKEEYHKLSDEFKEKYTSKISHLFLENR
jgi:transcriptional regulator CtsR